MALHSSVKNALIDADLMGLMATGAPSDEYDFEVSRLLPMLRNCNSVLDVQHAIQVLFREQFGAEIQPDQLVDISRRLLEVWRGSNERPGNQQ